MCPSLATPPCPALPLALTSLFLLCLFTPISEWGHSKTNRAKFRLSSPSRENPQVQAESKECLVPPCTSHQLPQSGHSGPSVEAVSQPFPPHV